MSDHDQVENTNKEIWRGPDEGNGSYYADALHITKDGSLGIDCGGYVYVKPIREWHRLAGGPINGLKSNAETNTRKVSESTPRAGFVDREACAKICDEHAAWAESKITDDPASHIFATVSNTANDCAEMIREQTTLKTYDPAAQPETGVRAKIERVLLDEQPRLVEIIARALSTDEAGGVQGSIADEEYAPDDDETYEMGVRAGYSEAVQNIDLATGGDGEFKGSTIPGETVDVHAMQARIIERLTPPRDGGVQKEIQVARREPVANDGQATKSGIE